MKKESWKKQTFWSLPVYTGDVSGVCSALYELGGMVVIHDPSGCNSTYNTHDEVRWMSMDSLIFISGLRDIDAITGNDEKLIDDTVCAAEKLHPAFIAFANSPIPWVNGTDFKAISRIVQQKTGIPTFYVGTNAAHDYTRGAGEAFLALAEMLFGEAGGRCGKKAGAETEEPEEIKEIKEPEETKEIREIRESKENGKLEGERQDFRGDRIRINVLGLTPLDFTVRKDVSTLRGILEEGGFELLSMWAMEDTLENLRKAGSADVNLLVSSTGLPLARYLKKRFGTPYVSGIPIGAFREPLFSALREAAEHGESQAAYLRVLREGREAARLKTFQGGEERASSAEAQAKTPAEGFPERRKCAVIGEPVSMGSLAAAWYLEGKGREWTIIATTETREALLSEEDLFPEGEEEIREALSSFDHVAGDPFYRKAVRAGTSFTALPHFAYSGRVYLSGILSCFEAAGNVIPASVRNCEKTGVSGHMED